MEVLYSGYQRWLQILQLSFLGGVFFAYFGFRLGDLVKTYTLILVGEESYSLGLIVFVCVAIILIGCLHRTACTEQKHIRHFLRYPPFPVAVVFGIIIAKFLPSISNGLLAVPRVSWIDSLCFASIYIIIWFIHVSIKPFMAWISRKYLSVDPLPVKISSSGISDNTLKKWLEYEEAITDREYDLFEHAAVADRIVERLHQNKATIALQGHFGSGKTSVCRMAAVEADRKGLGLLFVFASCWGFEESTRTQKEVLKAILAVVGKEVDCLSIQRLPTNYINAISSHNRWLETLIQLGGRELNPLEQLQRLSPILEAIGKKIVVVIEDVDRSGNNSHINQIQAMLMQFREVKNYRLF